MHLELWGHVDYWKDTGEPARIGQKAEWNPKGYKERTGQDFIDLDAYETKKGRIMLSLGEPQKNGVGEWFLDVYEGVYIEVFDTVTGKRSAFKAMKGYPLGQMPAPLPHFKHLLALEFPKAPTPDPQSDTAPDTLDLLLRTRDLAYPSGRKAMSVQAMFRNNSPNRMELSVNLLVCVPPDGKAWKSLEGLIKVGKGEDASREKTINVEPDAAVNGALVFDITDLVATKPPGWELSGLPKEHLLEISDRISGKTVWCAIRPGYPPGTDMKSFTITKNPVANSDNPPQNEPKPP
jgi:hypothetical protein